MKEHLCKSLHSQYFMTVSSRADDNDIDTALSFQWLLSSTLAPESEGFLIALQDQAVLTRSHSALFSQSSPTTTCRKCSQFVETVPHIVSGCPTLASNQYTRCHNNALIKDVVRGHGKVLVAPHYNTSH